MVDPVVATAALCPSWAPVIGYLGVAAAVILSNFGSAYGTWKAGVSLVHCGIRHPDSIMKNVIPIVMAGVIGIYGLIVAVILSQSISSPMNSRQTSYSVYTSMGHLAAGLCCGASGLAAGCCIGIIGDTSIRNIGYRASSIGAFPSTTPGGTEYADHHHSEQTDDDGRGLLSASKGVEEEPSFAEDQNKLFVGMLIMLIFSEALALYGLITALIVSQHVYTCGKR